MFQEMAHKVTEICVCHTSIPPKIPCCHGDIVGWNFSEQSSNTEGTIRVICLKLLQYLGLSGEQEHLGDPVAIVHGDGVITRN